MATSAWGDRLSPKIYSPEGGKLVGLECVSKTENRSWWIISFKRKEVWKYFNDDYLRVEVLGLSATDDELTWINAKNTAQYHLDRKTLEMKYGNMYGYEYFFCEILSAPEVQSRRYDLYSKKMEEENKI